MQPRIAMQRLRHAYRQHERTLVAIYLSGALMLAGLVGIGSLLEQSGKIRFLRFLTDLVDYWDDRWLRRAAYGEMLAKTGRYADAATYLAALDRRFPAQHVKHKWDKEREQLLQTLGRSYAELGRKKRALETYQRLVEFDPRNFVNHYLLAQTYVRFGKSDIAQQHFTHVLDIHPNHLPSVRARASYYFNNSDFTAVVAAYETYLNAFLLGELKVVVDDIAITTHAPVDGRFHDLVASLPRPAGWSGKIALYTDGYSVEVESLTLTSPLAVGQDSNSTTTLIWKYDSLMPNASPWHTDQMTFIRSGKYQAINTDSSIHINIPLQKEGIDKLHFRLRLFKEWDKELWDMVQKSYRNLLNAEGLSSVRQRLFIDMPSDKSLRYK